MPNLYFLLHTPHDQLRQAAVALHCGRGWVFPGQKSGGPGLLFTGSRKSGEFIVDTARRILREQTGTVSFEIIPVCEWEEPSGKAGMLFKAELPSADDLPSGPADGLMRTETAPVSGPDLQGQLFKKATELGKIRGVLLDMDGLIFDTERVYAHCWAQAAAPFGFRITESLIAEGLGIPSEKLKQLFADTFGRAFDYAAIRKIRDQYVEDYIRENGVPVKPGLFELLRYLTKRGVRKAVATSTGRQAAGKWLADTGVLEYLDAVVFGDMVSKGKPDPEIFLKACGVLGLAPEECLVLEDSPYGILAAHRAGMRPVMVPDLKQPDEETRKLLYARCDSLQDVARYGLV